MQNDLSDAERLIRFIVSIYQKIIEINARIFLYNHILNRNSEKQINRLRRTMVDIKL